MCQKARPDNPSFEEGKQDNQIPFQASWSHFSREGPSVPTPKVPKPLQDTPPLLKILPQMGLDQGVGRRGWGRGFLLSKLSSVHLA